MKTTPIPSAAHAEADPVLVLDRDEVRLSSRRGDAAAGSITATNRGGGMLQGSVAVRVGGEWLHAEPALLRLGPGEQHRLAVSADPAGLAPGYAYGELSVITNGGTASVAIRLGVGVQRLWGRLAAAVAASALVAILIGVVLAGVKVPADQPSSSPVTTPLHHGHGQTGTTTPAPTPRPAFDRPAALAAIGRAIHDSNSIWQAALTIPSAAALAQVKVGPELDRATSEAQELMAGGDHWEIVPRRFAVVSTSVGDDGQSGTGDVVKSERRALYGPGHARLPYEESDATYHLRYHLVHQNGRWLVDDITVLNITPTVTSGPALTVSQAAARVYPAVMRVQAEGGGQTDIGTGIVIQSSTTGSDIITNDHVVKAADAGGITLKRWIGARFQGPWTASYVWKDDQHDLAVIRIPAGNLPVAAWGDSNALQPGQGVVANVVAIGYAEDLSGGGPTITAGIVSSVVRTLPGDPSGQTYIQHSADINPGNSGGPLIEMTGRVVGVNTLTLEGTQGLYFAIPSSRAAPIAATWIGSNG